MNSQEEEYFKKLYERRTIITTAAEDPASENIWDGLVDKYTDNAHFVYELLQNASDAGATQARFELQQDKLIFAHNGRIHFTITDPSKEQEIKAKTEGTLGSVNAITSIGNSTKKNVEAKIGKFGIGFKAVYRYTETPYIYSPGNMFFMLEKKILPVIQHDDYTYRKPEETLFVLPFNSSYTSPEQAYSSIEKRLNMLQYPTLFLGELNEVICVIGEKVIVYSKSIDQKRSFVCNEIETQFITVTSNGKPERLWLMSRKLDGLKYSIGFFVGDDGNLVPRDCPAFCYFPTREQTGLKFIVHAPFRVNETREGIKEDDDHNKILMDLLSSLAADSIECMASLTKDDGSPLLSDTVLDVIPLTSTASSSLSLVFDELYESTFRKIKETFCSKKILPGQDGILYDKNNSVYSSDGKLQKCFPEDLLSELMEKEMHWIFFNIGNNGEKVRYLSEIVNKISYLDIAGKISASFVEKQSFEWLHRFYDYISYNKDRVTRSKSIPILLDTQKKAYCAFNSNDEAQIYLPPDNASDENDGPYHFIHKELLNNAETKAFIKALGVNAPKLEDYYDKVLLPKCGKKFHDVNEAADCLFYILKDYNKLSEDAKRKTDEILNESSIFICKNIYNNRQVFSSREHVYYPDNELMEYFHFARNDRHADKILFLDLDYYSNRFMFSQKGKDDFEKHLQRIKFLHVPELEESQDDLGSLVGMGILTQQEASRRTSAICMSMTGMLELLETLNYERNNDSSTASFLLWHFLLKILQQEDKKNGLKDIFYLVTKGPSCRDKKIVFSNREKLVKLLPWFCLFETEWILDHKGNFRKPEDITKQELNEKYEMNSYSDMLMENLGIKDAIVVNANLSEEDQKALNVGRIVRQHGVTEEKLKQLLKDYDAKGMAKKQVKSIQKEEIATENGKQVNSKPANDSFQQELQDEKLINSASTSSQVALSSALIAETDSSKQGNVQRSKMLTEEQRAYIEEQSGEAENKATQPVETTVLRRPRDPKIKEYVLERENGICLLCGKQGPFEYNGRYFLEAHHIIPCKDGGADTPENQAALCPNCHRKMHCLNLPEDVLKLKEKVSKTKKNNNEKKWELHT